MSDSESGMCQILQEYVMTLVKEEAEKLLITIKDHPGSHPEFIVGESVHNFCWLHELSRRAKVSQVIVELLLKFRKVKSVLMWAEHVVLCKWALKMLEIFKDLLAGHLFLNTSERSILVSDWIWMFKKEFLEDVNVGYLSELLTSIVLTFPLLEQQKIFNTWVESCTPKERILAQSYSTWLRHLPREATKHEPNSEGADNSTDKM